MSLHQYEEYAKDNIHILKNQTMENTKAGTGLSSSELKGKSTPRLNECTK